MDETSNYTFAKKGSRRVKATGNGDDAAFDDEGEVLIDQMDQLIDELDDESIDESYGDSDESVSNESENEDEEQNTENEPTTSAASAKRK
jgi:hypothetical protein